MRPTHVRLEGYQGSYSEWVPVTCGLWDRASRVVEHSPTCDYCRAVLREQLSPVVPISAEPISEEPPSVEELLHRAMKLLNEEHEAHHGGCCVDDDDLCHIGQLNRAVDNAG